jgi:hypothetical protein
VHACLRVTGVAHHWKLVGPHRIHFG